MKTILYISTKKSLDEKKEDVKTAFKYFTNIQPVWYASQHVLKFGDECSVSIYHFDENVYRGRTFDYIMESTIGLIPSVLRGCSSDVISKRFFSYTDGSRVGTVVFPLQTKLRSYDPSVSKYVEKTFVPKECIHSWKKYTGLRESFEYCEKCDEKKSG